MFSGETTVIKYCVNVKQEKNILMMSFRAKLEHRRPKYRSSKVADFEILAWNAMGCLLKSIFRGFQKQKGNIEINATEP